MWLQSMNHPTEPLYPVFQTQFYLILYKYDKNAHTCSQNSPKNISSLKKVNKSKFTISEIQN